MPRVYGEWNDPLASEDDQISTFCSLEDFYRIIKAMCGAVFKRNITMWMVTVYNKWFALFTLYSSEINFLTKIEDLF